MRTRDSCTRDDYVEGDSVDKHRRVIILGIGGCVCLPLIAGCIEEPNSSASGGNSSESSSGIIGCYAPTYASSGGSAVDCGLAYSFGDPYFDNRFSQEVSIQRLFFGLYPGVSPFNDCSGPNAISLPTGYILYGVNFARQAIQRSLSELPIAGVLAHEFAHQVQFQFGWMDRQSPTVRDTELEADAFSGYYMALEKGWAGDQLDSYFNFVFALGDYNFNHPSHHGTPSQRRGAAAIGFYRALDALRNQRQYSYSELHGYFEDELNAMLRSAATVKRSVSIAREVMSGTRSLRSLTNPYAHLRSPSLRPTP